MHKYLSHIILLFLGLGCVYGDLPELSADDPIEFDAENKTLTASGNARLTHDEFLLEADNVEFDQETLEATACGNVALTAPKTRIVGKQIAYNFDDETLYSGPYKLGQPPFFACGDSVEGCADDFFLHGTNVYFGEPDAISLNVYALDTRVENANNSEPAKIKVRNAFLRLGKLPIFYIPYYSYTSRDIPISMTNDGGGSNRFGFYARNTVLVDANPAFKWGGLMDYYTKRGVLYGPAFKYDYCNGSSSVRGNFKSGYIHDNGGPQLRRTDVRGKQVPKSRKFIEYRHKNNFQNCFFVTSQLRYWSDSEALRDFRPGLFGHDQDPDNFVEATAVGDYFFISAFTRFAPNNFQIVQERLPEINVDLLPNRPFAGIPLYQRMNASYVHLRQKDEKKGATPELRSDRFSVFYGLDFPINMGSALTVTPVVGGRVTHYPYHNAHSKHFTRVLGQFGLDAQFNTYGQWDVCSDIWRIDGLRHIFRPILQYRYFPDSSSGCLPIPLIEPDITTTNLPPMDLGYLRNRDFGEERNRIRLGLENVFQTRADDFGSRDLAQFNVYQDYLFETRKTEYKWSDLFTEFTLHPAYWINVGVYSRTHVENWTLKELRTRLTLTNARHWTLNFTTDSFHHKTNQFYLDGAWNVDPRTTLYGKWRYDHKLESLTRQSYGLETRLGNNWKVNVEVTRRTGSLREQDWELGFLLTLVPLGVDIYQGSM